MPRAAGEVKDPHVLHEKVAPRAIPGDPTLRTAAIMVAMRTRDFTGAADIAEAARRDGVADAQVFGLKGHALSSLGRHGEATAAYAEALKLAPVWGSFAAAGWSFAVTFGIGEAAIHLCREEALGRKATPAALREAFRQGHQEGAALHGAGRGSASY